MNIESLGKEQGSQEQEKFVSRIWLAFFRHSEKGPKPEELLTPAGTKLAKEKSPEHHPTHESLKDISQALAFGSPRLRAQHTAGEVMAGGRDDITGEESLEELRAKLDEGRKYGTRIASDKRLDFCLDKTTEFGKIGLARFERHEWLKFLIEDSDELAEQLGDQRNTTYSRAAAAVAEIVKKYIQVEQRWDELVKTNDYKPTLERYFGSHQGVIEAFLAKVIEKTKGIKERDKFVVVLGNHGFDYVDGCHIEIINPENGDSSQPRVIVSYGKKDKDGKIIFDFREIIDEKLIDKIIGERK